MFKNISLRYLPSNYLHLMPEVTDTNPNKVMCGLHYIEYNSTIHVFYTDNICNVCVNNIFSMY